MKNKSKLNIITLIVVLICLVSIIGNQNYSNKQSDDEESVKIRNDINLIHPKMSATYSEPFIFIDGNWSEATAYDWCYGDGSWENPYVIENVSVDASSSPIESGIYINNSKNAYFIIRNCNITNAAPTATFFSGGIKLENTCNGTLINNNCSYNDENGIYLRNNCKNNTILGNIAYGNGHNGIYLNNSCEENNISANFLNYNVGDGIRLYYDCSNNFIQGNEVLFNTNDGILLRYNSSFNTILENTAKNSKWNGVDIRRNCTNNNVSKNILNNNLRGIMIRYHSSDNTISENTINENHRGIDVRANSTYNDILRNTFKYNNYSIIISSRSNSSIITGNLFMNNVNYSINIYDADCKDHIIYQNTFIGTVEWHALDNGLNNQWDNTEIGNYWDNHTSADSNNDGIVDAPYPWITGSAPSADRIDHYPLRFPPIHYLGEHIHIDDLGVSSYNWSTTAKVKLWCTGSGTYSNPYVIADLEVDGLSSENCFLIENSNVFFEIRNCNATNSIGGTTPTGIRLQYTSHGKLIRNNCSNNVVGIYLISSNNNTILGNRANDNNLHGIELIDGSSYNNISGNIASSIMPSSQDYGICLWNDCENNTISDNTVNNNIEAGILLNFDSFNNSISGNTANGNDHGLDLMNDCENNTISNNDFINNEYGMYIYSGINNKIYLNNFSLNSYNAWDSGDDNQWDNGTIGNYWDDYDGVDANDDGIGDTPYEIDGTAQSEDRFPIWDDGPYSPLGSDDDDDDGTTGITEEDLYSFLFTTIISAIIGAAISIIFEKIVYESFKENLKNQFKWNVKWKIITALIFVAIIATTILISWLLIPFLPF